MTPSMDLRLASMCRALAETILPNLHDELASEQAKLVLAHLQVIRKQVDYVTRYEELECAARRRLVENLLVDLAGGDRTQSAAAKLGGLVGVDSCPHSPAEVRDFYDSLNAGIDELIRACDEDGNESFKGRARALVLAEASDAALRSRSWFGGMGFEPQENLQPIPQMMREMESSAQRAPAA